MSLLLLLLPATLRGSRLSRSMLLLLALLSREEEEGILRITITDLLELGPLLPVSRCSLARGRGKVV